MGDGPCAKPPSWLVFGKACLQCIESSYKMIQIPGRQSFAKTSHDGRVVPGRNLVWYSQGTRIMSLFCIFKSLRKTTLRGDVNIQKRILILLLNCTPARRHKINVLDLYILVSSQNDLARRRKYIKKDIHLTAELYHGEA